ncbi:MAG: glycine--tRNA ligase [Candidatus Omnitrophica bacterium CG08_land_8_20_14_0_20_41_16]|uniref:Glycine--tRNA ligase n=1 Tax=Candidatus Sherwoodlollariibacterium unditelluris TaxID=1974757 RepID=A0A2G9YHR8_9BACT|nr:MAG: glycine--tRNA ligase [Candidatus Omnitrophica bacterium CG23_combo_of_CG06-09_8_20_14_all_41_10]PIS33775.1 MAG: glycine--tRNA ligase [Candidatus Omnitrophica bacterium CG08_land_8_20_14_0_20_41_16]
MDSMERVVSLCKRRGFIFQSSDIYGGLSNSWDYGPYGVELKNNLKRAWWKANVYERDDILGMDAAILMHPKVWEASGHVKNFFDLKSDCKSCKLRFKASDLKDKNKCPECGGQLTEERAFNLMFETNYGAVEDKESVIYLRPETAQGMFVNFLNILDSRHSKLPFGLAQIGKAFRNEITPGNFTFRTREFEQMEIEYFVKPDDAEKAYKEWVETRYQWYLNLGISKENLRLRPHGKDELAHYALACTDIEYKFSFGWSELEGIANRTNFDLKQHAQYSGKDLRYFDDSTKERFYPYVIEPSGGVDRATLAFLVDAYYEEKVRDDIRVVLKINKDLAPVKVAVFPLLRNRPEIVGLAKKIAGGLKKNFICVYDDTGAIGKLYRRQDEVGTLFCVTVDVQSLEDKQVTVRDRDTMLQERIGIDKLKEYLNTKLTI